MSLSLMTLMGNQKPTRDEKYIISQTIKILRFNRYPEDDATPMMRAHNKPLDQIIKDLKKVLNKEVRR